MLTLRATVFDAPVMGTVTVYSDPTWDGALATADKLLIQATTAQAAGTTRKLTVDLERSNDRESWVVETTLINGQPLSTTTTESWFAQDLGTGTVPGRFRRLALYFTDSGASAHVRVAVAGRARRSKVMRRAASAAAGAAPPAGKAGCSCSGGRCSSGTAATARAGSAPPQLREATFAAPPLRLSAGLALCGSARVPAMLPLPLWPGLASFGDCVVRHMTPLVGDLDGDGIPELMGYSFGLICPPPPPPSLPPEGLPPRCRFIDPCGGCPPGQVCQGWGLPGRPPYGVFCDHRPADEMAAHVMACRACLRATRTCDPCPRLMTTLFPGFGTLECGG